MSSQIEETTMEPLNKPKRMLKKVPKSREFLSKTAEEISTLEDSEQSELNRDENKKEKKCEKKEVTSPEKRGKTEKEIKKNEEEENSNSVSRKTKPKSVIVGISNNSKIKHQAKRAHSTSHLLTSEDEAKPKGFLSLLNEDGIEILQKLMDEKDHQLEKMRENHSLVEDEPEPQGFLSQLSNAEIEKLKQNDAKEVTETKNKSIVSPERSRKKSKSPESKKKSAISPETKKKEIISPETGRKREIKGKKQAVVPLSAESRSQSKPQGFLEHLPDASAAAFVPPHVPQGFLSFFNEDDKDLLQQLTEEKQAEEEALAELNAVEAYVPNPEDPSPQGFLEYLPKPAIEFIPPHEPQGFLTFMPKPALEFIPNNEPAGFLTFLEAEDQKFLKNTRK